MEDYRHGPSASGASAPSPVPALEQPRHIPVESAQFDIFDWHPAYTSCQRFFLDHAQHEHSVRAVCALINIKLPCQWTEGPIPSAEASVPSRRDSVPFQTFQRREQAQDEKTTALNWVSLVPYVRRLVVTGFDREAVMHGMFGDDWRKGIGPVQECERRNYLFAAKSGGWLHVKSQYDMGPQETVPFLQPPQSIAIQEIHNAEKLWSQWLAMEDWMIGPRAPGINLEEDAAMDPESGEMQATNDSSDA